MRRTRVIGLALAATLSVAAVTAGSALAALPEFSGPFSKPFTSSSKSALFETVGGKKLKCTSVANSGEITSPNTGTITITFSGCKLGKLQCNTPGAAPGTIVTSLLQVAIHYINQAKKIVGADLFEPGGSPIMSYACGPAIRGIVIGSVIGRLTPINKLVIPSAVFKLVFQQTLGNQKYPNLEGGPIDILETSYGGPFEATGLASVDSILFAEPVTLFA